MSAGNEQAQTAVNIELNDEQVREYLKENNDFLQRNPDMLDHLHISHASGSAISLVEKQVSVLRERNMDMRHRLTNLTANARDNDKLYEQTRTLVMALLEATDLDSLYRCFMHSLDSEFKVEHACMIIFGDPDQAGKCRIETLESAKTEIGPLLRSQKPTCGVLRQQELSYLFPNAKEMGSAALMPLSNGSELGLIAVGSSDANRYSSNMGTLFLSHIADIMVRILPKLTSAVG